MISKKKGPIELVLGNGDKLYKTVIESEDCKKDTEKAQFIMNRIFRMLFETPQLAMCGEKHFEEMTIKHSGEKWIIQFTAIKEKT